MRLPVGLREQPGWVLIGAMIFLLGLGYVTGFTETNVARLVGDIGVRVWGGFLTLSGLGVVWATTSAKPALEKLSLRTLALCWATYAGWIFTITSFRRSAIAIGMAVLIVGLSEIRIAFLKALIRHNEQREKLWRELGETDDT